MFSGLTTGHDESSLAPMLMRAHRYDVHATDTGETSTDVRSPTSTSTEVRSPTSTSTKAYTQGNFTATVTGGAGAGATNVSIYANPLPEQKNVYSDTGGRDFMATGAKMLNQASSDLAEIRKTREPTDADYATIKAKYGVTLAPPHKSLLGKIGSAVGSVAKAAGSVAKVAGSVASYVPGVGTAVGAGLKIAGAAASGENIAKAAVDAAKTSMPYATMAIQAANLASDIAHGKNVAGSLKARAAEAALSQIPGGEYGQQLAKSVANVAAAGIKGQNLVKAGAREVVASAVAMAPAVSRETLNAAISAAASGKNPLKGAAAGAVRSALAQIPDSAARKTAQDALAGVSAAKVLAQAPKGLLAKAAAAVPGGGAATAIKAITGKDSLMNVHRPILTSVTSGRPIFFDRASVSKAKSGVSHIPMSGAAKSYVRARAGLLARDAAGLRADGK